MLRRSRRKVGLVLVYHGVAERSGPPDAPAPTIGIDRFEGHLRHLRSRYRVVPPSEIVAAVSARGRGDPFPVALSFDDDLASHRELAAPALRSAGLPAAFFIGGGALGEADIAALARDGFEIGFHTVRHECLPALDDGELRAALTDGRDRLARASGSDPNLIAYPFGAADGRVAEAARVAGYTLGFTTAWEAVTLEGDPLLIGRLNLSRMSRLRFSLQLVRELAMPGGSRR